MSTSPRFCSVLGNWREASIYSVDTDLEAQAVTGAHAPFTLPAAFQAAHSAATPTHTPQQNDNTTDPIDDFFGVTRYTRATRESRHDSYVAPSPISVALDGEVPPPYMNVTEPPAYNSTPAEPVTLAMYLYRFGFGENTSALHPSSFSDRIFHSISAFLGDWSNHPGVATQGPCRL